LAGYVRIVLIALAPITDFLGPLYSQAVFWSALWDWLALARSNSIQDLNNQQLYARFACVYMMAMCFHLIVRLVSLGHHRESFQPAFFIPGIRVVQSLPLMAASTRSLTIFRPSTAAYCRHNLGGGPCTSHFGPVFQPEEEEAAQVSGHLYIVLSDVSEFVTVSPRLTLQIARSFADLVYLVQSARLNRPNKPNKMRRN
jgi:hypothetical protein